MEGNGGVDTNDHVVEIQDSNRNGRKWCRYIMDGIISLPLRYASTHLRGMHLRASHSMSLAEGSKMEGNDVDTNDQNDHVVEILEENITVFRMTRNLAAKLNKVPSQNLQECCIHRVPPVFRNGNEEAYTPQMVSIGPFHHGCKNLQAMELHKLRYLNDFLKRRPEMKLEQFIDSLTRLEERARLCYGEPIDLTSDEFVEMMLIDGCFIIELLLKMVFRETRDTLSTSVLMLDVVQEEITVLLENQLPLFVLEHLFNLIKPLDISFLKLIVGFVSLEHVDRSVSQSIQQVKHFVDLQRKFYVPTSPRRIPPNTDYELKFIPSATELHASGVKFTKDKRPCFLNITFTKDDGVFNIPSIQIFDDNNRRFRNLIALEHFDEYAGYISNYTTLMDCLINTPGDVALLRRNGIIDNWIGEDQEVSLLFNKIGKGKVTGPNTFYYAKLFEDVNSYYEKRRHKWRATLTRDYFGTPWSIISFLAAFVLLGCTFLQTLYPFKKP